MNQNHFINFFFFFFGMKKQLFLFAYFDHFYFYFVCYYLVFVNLICETKFFFLSHLSIRLISLIRFDLICFNRLYTNHSVFQKE